MIPAPDALARGYVREPTDAGLNPALTEADSGSPESVDTPQEQGR